MKELAKKLLEVQKEVGPVMKDADNPYYKSKYADINKFIEVVKPILSKHGVVVLQPLTHIVNGVTGERVPAIMTALYDAESGDSLVYEFPLPSNPDPQKQGSAITYFRRYALQSLLFLEAQDDDANAASGKDEKKKGDGKPPTQTEDILDF